MDLFNLNKVVIFFILFVSRQGFCPNDHNLNSINDYMSAYNICIKEVKGFFDLVNSPLGKARHTFLNVVVSDNIPEYARKFIKLLGLCIDASKCASLKDYCQIKKENIAKEMCLNELYILFKSIYDGFNEYSALDSVLVSYYYLRDKEVKRIKNEHLTDYYGHLLGCLDIHSGQAVNERHGYLSLDIFCDHLGRGKMLYNLSKSVIGKDYMQCVSTIHSIFKNNERPIEHAGYALLYLSFNEEIPIYIMEYYNLLFLCLDSSDVPSVFTYCNSKPVHIQTQCLHDIHKTFEKFKKGAFDIQNALDSLVTAFKHISVYDLDSNVINYSTLYFHEIHLSMKINTGKTTKNEFGYLSPEELCDSLVKEN